MPQDVADSCRTGAATNIIFGLALGYKSAIVPCLVIAVAIYVSFSLANMYGIACAALGMLTTMSTGARAPLPPLLVEIVSMHTSDALALQELQLCVPAVLSSRPLPLAAVGWGCMLLQATCRGSNRQGHG